MTVRSYAQNFEDVLLWRVLREVPAGSYVDVGAGHPEYHSVTKLFYDQGWSGVNIEPVPALAQLLRERRPRDTTLQAAVGAGGDESIELTVVTTWDELSTTDPARRQELEAEGRSLATVTVPVVTLADAIADAGLTDVHFLKVDVEGGELEVLSTIDLAATRPWLVVVEVVSADSSSKDAEAIRHYLETRGYVFAYFDGLNHFYVADERSEALLPFFALPVNVRDDFTPASDAGVVADRIGELLGLVPPVQPGELLQRVEALLGDRFEYEKRLREALEGFVPGEDDGAQTRLWREKEAVIRDQEEAIRLLKERQETAERAERIEAQRSDALAQALFERDRLVAWYAAEAANLRGALREQTLAADAGVQAERRLRASEGQVADLLASTSWRVTLPLRAIRRPGTYLRALVRR